MKLVREHINEKFEKNSDPIRDIGIGYDFDKLKPDNILRVKESVELLYISPSREEAVEKKYHEYLIVGLEHKPFETSTAFKGFGGIIINFDIKEDSIEFFLKGLKHKYSHNVRLKNGEYLNSWNENITIVLKIKLEYWNRYFEVLDRSELTDEVS